jgi:BirA family biotin operon repressor/biotin-[acetyl-CoA-carboxylase] ligase
MDGLPPVSLDTLFSGDRPSRNRVAAAIIGELRKALAEFAESGFAGFADEWQQHDCLYDRPVTVQIGARTQSGLARGISAAGALLLESGGRLESVISGEVTLRTDA